MTAQQQSGSGRQSGGSLLLDAHVHLYDCFDRSTFFDAASNNFQHAAKSLDLPPDTPGCLMLTETAKDHAFESLIAQRELDDGRWRFNPAGDGRSLIVSRDGQDILTVIAGRQVVTKEGLEVLALCCNDIFADGLAIEQTIEKIIDADALPVLPFGVGKWSGKRGKVIDRLLNSPQTNPLMLGDNAGRLALAGEPKQFAIARQRNMWVLPGTDPLPLASQAARVASFGLLLDIVPDSQAPAASIKRCLLDTKIQPITYGKPTGPLDFLKCQTTMQIRKRLKKH